MMKGFSKAASGKLCTLTRRVGVRHGTFECPIACSAADRTADRSSYEASTATTKAAGRFNVRYCAYAEHRSGSGSAKSRHVAVARSVHRPPAWRYRSRTPPRRNRVCTGGNWSRRASWGPSGDACGSVSARRGSTRRCIFRHSDGGCPRLRRGLCLSSAGKSYRLESQSYELRAL